MSHVMKKAIITYTSIKERPFIFTVKTKNGKY